jgi:hypothetical protein
MNDQLNRCWKESIFFLRHCKTFSWKDQENHENLAPLAETQTIISTQNCSAGYFHGT